MTYGTGFHFEILPNLYYINGNQKEILHSDTSTEIKNGVIKVYSQLKRRGNYELLLFVGEGSIDNYAHITTYKISCQ